MPRLLRRLILLALCLFPALAVHANDRRQAEVDAWQAVRKTAVKGPHDITLNDQAKLNLPSGYIYIPHDAAARLLRVWGSKSGDSLLGMIMPLDGSHWFMVVQYDQSGYIKDDDAKHWDSGHLLENLKKGTEQGNDFRKQQGLPPVEVVGWVQPPRYDSEHHRLIWSAKVRDKGQPASDQDSVNYNTYLLGRHGYVSMNMVTDLADVDQEKPLAKSLLKDVSFDAGKRYQDFNGSTDKVAAYGLAALVGGLAAKKLGLLALFGVYFAKFWKILAVVGAALATQFRRLFRRGG